MGNVAMDRTDTTLVEHLLREELERDDRAFGSVAPVIQHMLASSAGSLVNDALVARLRGMLMHIAEQLLGTGSQGADSEECDPHLDQLADALAASVPLLNHLYSVALEGELTQRLEQRASIEPVLTGLLQELIASDDPAVAELAMQVLTAQSRFIQSQRRMEMPVGELPAELFAASLDEGALAIAQGAPGDPRDLDALKSTYNEANGRLALLARLVSSMHAGALAALELEHSGLALFATALARLTRQPRNTAVLSCHERQAARLALGLRAAGQDRAAMERQFMLFDPVQRLPEGLYTIPPERAQHLLATSGAAALT